MGIYLIYIPPYCPSNGLPQYIHYWRDSRAKTPPEYNVRMGPSSCPPMGSPNTPPNGHHPINSGQTLQTRAIRGGPITCRRDTRKCHHRESNPAPPCPEPYAVTKYRAEKSVPIGDISHIYNPVLPEQLAPAVHPLLARQVMAPPRMTRVCRV